MEDIPLKKRRLWHLSLSSRAQTCLPAAASEEFRSSQFGNSFQHLGVTEKLLDRSFPSSQKLESNMKSGASDESVAVQSADRLCEVKNEFAAMKVEASIGDMPSDEVVPSTAASLGSQHLLKKDSVNLDDKGAVVQDDSSTCNFNNDEDDGALERSIPLKTNRLHWDLNTMMEEWEEPCVETFNSHINNSECLLHDDMQSGMVTSEVSNVQKDATGIQCDIGGNMDSLPSGLVSSDRDGIQKIENHQCMVVETKSPGLERHVLQVCSGATNTEKISAVFETKAPTMVISTNNLHTCDCPRSDHSNCPISEGNINTSFSMLVQYEKDNPRTPAAVLCKSSSQSSLAEKTETDSVDMPSVDKSVFYADSIKSEGRKDFERESGEDPTNCSGKLTSEDPSSGCNSSVVFENNLVHVISVEKTSDLQSGYDSPIEDGELREPAVYSCRNDEVECSETGQLDIGLIDANYTDASEKCYDNEMQFCKHKEDANIKLQNDEVDGKGLEAGEFKARQYKQKVPSHIGTHNTYLEKRKNFAYMQRQRSDPFSLSQAKREIDYQCSFRKNFSFPGFGENEMSHRQVDFPISYQEPRTSYSRNYRGRKDPGYSMPRRVGADPIAEGTKFNCYDNRSSVNDIYRPSTRRRPAERDDSHGSRRRAPPLRGFSDAYKKENPEMHTQSGRRNPKEEYDMSRRESGFSSNFVRAAHIVRSQRNSQLQSCSSSPPHVSREQEDRRYFKKMARQSQTQRAKFVDFPRRFKSDDNLRSFIRRKRKLQVAAAGRCSFEDGDYDRNVHNDKFETNGRVEHYKSNDKWFQHNADGSFKFDHVQDDSSPNTQRSDVPGTAKCSTRYSTDRIRTTRTSREQEIKEASRQTDVPKTVRKVENSSRY